jgi:hypothetical protein
MSSKVLRACDPAPDVFQIGFLSALFACRVTILIIRDGLRKAEEELETAKARVMAGFGRRPFCVRIVVQDPFVIELLDPNSARLFRHGRAVPWPSWVAGSPPALGEPVATFLEELTSGDCEAALTPEIADRLRALATPIDPSRKTIALDEQRWRIKLRKLAYGRDLLRCGRYVSLRRRPLFVWLDPGTADSDAPRLIAQSVDHWLVG